MRFLKPRKPNHDGDWVVVAHATGQTEAEIVAGRLRTEDIPCYIHQEGIGRVLGLSVGLGLVTVLVPIQFEDEAVALLDDVSMDDLPPQIEDPPIHF